MRNLIAAGAFVVALLVARGGIMSAQTTSAAAEARNKATVERSFNAWRDGTGSPYDLLADNATWTIVGRKALGYPHLQRRRSHGSANHAGPTSSSSVSMWSSDGRDLLPSASASEIRNAYGGYYAYFGRWEIDEGTRTVTHRIRGSMRGTSSASVHGHFGWR